MLRENIREILDELAEEKYASFSMSLIPECKERMLGVRLPQLRKIAKQLIKEGQGLAYLKLGGELVFEEKMLKMLVFGNIKLDIETKLCLAKNLICDITNWSLCDSFCNEFKDVKMHKGRVWGFLSPYWLSAESYELRVAVVLSLFYFIEADYLPELFQKYEAISSEDYYVKMAVAWAVSMCFVKFENQTLSFLQSNELDDFTHNKTLQKIRESLQVSPQAKAEIKALKRK